MDYLAKKRYMPYSTWNADTLLHMQAQTANSKYQMHYHIHPISGLLNDPNGFSYFNGEYHLFYQSYPFGAVHGLKSWFHSKSDDLVHWINLGLAIEPDSIGDSHGVYSGSAKVIDDKLFLMYTGNHRNKNWQRIPYQMSAWMNKDGHIQHKQILFKNPNHITEHFRDPQIIKEKGIYYALLGAQDKLNKHGHVDIWQSKNLKNWSEIGFLNFSDKEMGHMIECPNLVEVDGKSVLIFCPQGLNKEIANYKNIYPNMYIIGDATDLSIPKMLNPSNLCNLDNGFDIYATQAFNAPNGNAYAISWVGLPDISYPTDTENWANCLSQVKKLKIRNGKLFQQPVSAIKTLRYKKEDITDKLPKSNSGQQYELKLTIATNQKGKLYLAANDSLNQYLELDFDTKIGRLTLNREKTGQLVAQEYGMTRSVILTPNQKLKLDIFVDHSMIEIFINNGEKVMTSRFFNNPKNQIIRFDHKINYQGKFWKMRSII